MRILRKRSTRWLVHAYVSTIPPLFHRAISTPSRESIRSLVASELAKSRPLLAANFTFCRSRYPEFRGRLRPEDIIALTQLWCRETYYGALMSFSGTLVRLVGRQSIIYQSMPTVWKMDHLEYRWEEE